MKNALVADHPST